MERESITLKPCPFCGSKAEILSGYSGCEKVYFVICGDCQNRTSSNELTQTVIAAWNRRVK